ncbi:hypothetical protein QFC21_006312 [Naganishia friedmannii]|uniref:Uncharacterized protein n=1 Tax=Naganishia friedmannii TaxID=89922 RepID=A0ACC2V4Z4_9TREE|nr:hypothetical protein QFC21_006312 [Naganishia friedmannii]
MGTLRGIDARQMADEPLVVSRGQWLKEREDVADARRETGPIRIELAKLGHQEGNHPDFAKKDKGKGKKKETATENGFYNKNFKNFPA